MNTRVVSEQSVLEDLRRLRELDAEAYARVLRNMIDERRAEDAQRLGDSHPLAESVRAFSAKRHWREVADIVDGSAAD